ncbi:MAG: molybdopterin-dependent oxidoreductase [Firmicutes bacterium]|jgi:CO/xanthine dehydrogenase Mo-binding subunit|nr:molybdopterin-dependent oxidoreductase [Bacillota bacterium]
MNQFNVIGQSVIKKDTMAKITGQAQFAGDMEFENMLYGAVKRSEVPSAIVKNIDISKAEALPGVVKVLTYKDIPGSNRVGIIIKDEPVLVEDRIRRIGDAIAIVAAESKDVAEEALELIEVEIEKTPGVFDMFEALKDESPKVHGESNILASKQMIKGDTDAAFEQCDVIVENVYKTNYIAHMFIEPEAGVAKYENGVMTFWGSTQNPHYDRGEVAKMLKLPQNKVRSIQATTGGGFGGKLDISVQCHAALLSFYTERPVKIVRSREESMLVSAKRHPHVMRFKTGATKDGKLLAWEVEMFGDTGAYASYGPAVITRAIVHATGPYEVPNVKIKADMMYTNNPMAGAMRGFGVPQVAIGHEGQMDALAEKLGISPFEIRMINAYKVGSTTASDQVLTDSVGIRDTLEQAMEKAKEVIFTNGGDK